MKGLKTKMNKIVNDNLRVGDKFKGNINNINSVNKQYVFYNLSNF